MILGSSSLVMEQNVVEDNNFVEVCILKNNLMVIPLPSKKIEEGKNKVIKK